MTLCELTMFPTDKGVSVSPYVARILDIIDKSGVAYKLTPMSTILEGNWDAVMNLVSACFRALEADCERINVSMKVDYRRGTEPRMTKKIDAVERHLGRTLSS
jgi:uncharacterized protein (TIGR00106 family)